MDIVELGAIGELVGGVAVVASLLYVGMQMRQGNRLARVQVHQEAARMSTDVAFRTDAEAAALFRRGAAELQRLSPEERASLRARFVASMNYYEMLYYARQHGQVDDDLWESRVGRMRRNVSLSPPFWQEWKGEFGRAFQVFVDEHVMPYRDRAEP